MSSNNNFLIFAAYQQLWPKGRDMKTVKTFLPGSPGTKKLVKHYGKRLIRVRYRYDDKHDAHVKTVELLVEKEQQRRDPRYIPHNKLMRLRVEHGEIEADEQIRAAGGVWNRDEKLWILAYREVVKLGLTDRIVQKPVRNNAS